MNLFKNKTSRFILILAIIAGLLLGLKIILTTDKSQEKIILPPSPPPSPTFSLSPTPKIMTPEGDLDAPLQIRKEIQRDYPLFDFIPYKTKNWQIDYLKPLTLEIILRSDTLANRQEVLNWIKEKGIDPATHEIVWKIEP